jgi:hypothetical protein
MLQQLAQTQDPAALSPSSALEVSEPGALTSIYQPEINVCQWRRPVDEAACSYAAQTLGQYSFQQSYRVRAGDLGKRPLALDLPPGPDREAFLADLTQLVQLYLDLFEPQELGLRLGSLTGAMCPRFHVDRVEVRLICTYHGRGTEYLENHAVDRRHLGHLACGRRDEESGLIRGPVRRLGRFAVGLLKGERWPGNEGSGAVHRSPGVDPREGRRVLLTLESAA